MAPGGLGVAGNLNDLVGNVAVLVHGAPNIALVAVHRVDDLVEAPNVAPARLLGFQAGLIGVKFHGRATDGFIREDESALERNLLHKA